MLLSVRVSQYDPLSYRLESPPQLFEANWLPVHQVLGSTTHLGEATTAHIEQFEPQLGHIVSRDATPHLGAPLLAVD